MPDLKQFPLSKWQKHLHNHSSRLGLLGNQGIQANLDLRVALCDYLATSRSVRCSPERIIITSGAQQALSIVLLAILQSKDPILMEQPGYSQMRKIINLFNYQYHPVPVEVSTGLHMETVLKSDAKALYITPSNQYPMGTTLNTEQRLKLIEWANMGKRWIIEDDYDSEFQFAHRPYTSLQGLAAQIEQDAQVIYIGSFSKAMFNSLRMGYLIVPESIVDRCLAIKDAMTGDSPAHIQAALADFIVDGDLLRHIRRMRRLYKTKHQQMISAIQQHLGDSVTIISQAAGLHITLKWSEGIDEEHWSQLAEKSGIIIRPLSYYEDKDHINRDWNGAVLGFGNVEIEDIEPKIAHLAALFYGRLKAGN